MARNERSIHASADEVFSVLGDGWGYHRWVVGAKVVRKVDPAWPQPGARLHHTIGVGPIRLEDDTKVLEADPPHRLVLEARGRPFGRARIAFHLATEDGATTVVMDEVVTSPEWLTPLNLLVDPLTRVRNAETLRRLDRVVGERRSPT